MTYQDLDVMDTSPSRAICNAPDDHAPNYHAPNYHAPNRRTGLALAVVGLVVAGALVWRDVTDRHVSPQPRTAAASLTRPADRVTPTTACTGRELVGYVARRHVDRTYGFIVVAVMNHAPLKCWVRGYPYFSVRSPRSSYIGVGVGFQGADGVLGVVDPGDHVIWLQPDQVASFAIGARSGAPGAPRSATIEEFDFLPFGGTGPTLKVTRDGGLMTVTTHTFSDFQFGITAYARGII